MTEKSTKTEKKWKAHGYKCKVLFVRQSHRCGHVAVPKGHVAYDKSYGDLPIDVHGGLTFDNTVEKDGVCWFGFDCAHLGDRTGVCSLHNDDHFWTLEEVIKETEKMAKQFNELTLRKIIEHKLRWMPGWFKNNITITVGVVG